MLQVPKPTLIKIDAWLAIFALALLLIVILVFILGFYDIFSDKQVVIAFQMFSATLIAHIILAGFLKCPICNQHPTLQSFKPVHPNSNKKWGMDGWAVVIVNVALDSKFRCIHCGSEFHL